MGETLDLVLSDESMTFIEAFFLLRKHLRSCDKEERKEFIRDLQEAFPSSSKSISPWIKTDN